MENKKHLKTNLKPIKKEKNFVIKGDKIILKRNKYGAKIRPNTKGISKTSRRDALNEFDKKELKKARISFRKILNQNVMKHTKLKELALQHAKNLSTDPIMNGPYALYLRVSLKKYPEAKEDRVSRLIVNYLRHMVIDYDERCFYASIKKDYSLPYFDELYKIALEEIIRCYPKYKYAYNFSLETKRDWKIMQKTKKSILFPGIKTGKIFGIAATLKTKEDYKKLPYWDSLNFLVLIITKERRAVLCHNIQIGLKTVKRLVAIQVFLFLLASTIRGIHLIFAFVFIKIWHTICMDKIDKIEHEGGCSFFYSWINKKIATLVAGGNINVY